MREGGVKVAGAWGESAAAEGRCRVGRAIKSAVLFGGVLAVRGGNASVRAVVTCFFVRLLEPRRAEDAALGAASQRGQADFLAVERELAETHVLISPRTDALDACGELVCE